ncbi:protein of unknown function [Xenorhabdus poinarii G6]|uniref:Uncharacterized protein n=1 Tax=Xenorhabdus poinarii G6 TaxID=1354304 RepID=A0A068R2Y6_9GAMM|nr:protein of unknown function [Xenorhabdus poinarii G6]
MRANDVNEKYVAYKRSHCIELILLIQSLYDDYTQQIGQYD